MTTPDEIAKLCLEANADDNCAGLILWMHTFSPSKMWIRGLNALQKPFVHLHTQFNQDLPWSTIDMDFMNLNQSAHGDREAGFIHTRMRLARKVVVGHWSDPEVQERIGAWMRAARAWHDWQGARFCRFGDNMRQVAVTEGDKVAAEMKFGFSTNGYGVGDLVEDGRRRVGRRGEARWPPNTRSSTTSRPSCAGAARGTSRSLYGARLELGLRAFLGKGGFKGFTTTFEDLHGLKQLPGLAPQRLMADGFGFGGRRRLEDRGAGARHEGHGRGAAGRDLVHGGLHLPPAARRPTRARRAHARGLPVDRRSASRSLEIHPLSIGGREDPVRLVFNAPAGPALNATLIDLGSRFRLLVNEVTAVDHPVLPKLPVARAVWECKPDFKTACAAWILAGGAHHTGFSYAVTAEMLEDFATIAGIEFVRIGEGTRDPGVQAGPAQQRGLLLSRPGLPGLSGRSGHVDLHRTQARSLRGQRRPAAPRPDQPHLRQRQRRSTARAASSRSSRAASTTRR